MSGILAKGEGHIRSCPSSFFQNLSRVAVPFGDGSGQGLRGARQEAVFFFALEDKGSLVFEKSDELIRSEDGADFDAVAMLDEYQTLSGLQTEGFSNLLRDDDLVFGRQNRCCHTKSNSEEIG